MANSKVKFLVVGLDGASYPLILEWSRKGLLPHITRMMEGGASGLLHSVPNLNSAPAWTSFATGCNPGKHGIFYFYERVPDSYRIRYLNGGHCACERFWSILSRAGCKVGVINVPMTFPVEPVNGFAIAGMDAPSVTSAGFCHPSNLLQRITAQGIPYVIEPGITGYVKSGKKRKAVEKAYQAEEARTDAALFLQAQDPCDLLVVVYRILDVIQHHFWHYMDPAHPCYDRDEATQFAHVVQEAYQKVDAALGRLLDQCQDDQTTVVLLSDHGAGPAEGGVFLLREFLTEIGCITARAPAPNSAASLGKRMAKAAYGWTRRLTSRRLKERLLAVLPGLRDRLEGAVLFGDIDWARSQAYCTRDRTEVWINMRGREPEGIVAPGKEYDEVCAHITERLHAWRDPDTGKPAVARVQRGEEVYAGPFADKAPDLLITWNDPVFVNGIALEGTPADQQSKVRLDPRNWVVTGKHVDTGFFALHGPAIVPGRELTGAQILDIAPTILYLAGQPVPRQMDGQVLRNAVTPTFLARHPIQYDEPPEGGGTRGAAPPAYQPEEIHQIEDRLRSLGYIE